MEYFFFNEEKDGKEERRKRERGNELSVGDSLIIIDCIFHSSSFLGIQRGTTRG
jgi:hypothetical protein